MKHSLLLICLCALITVACKPTAKTSDENIGQDTTSISLEGDTTIWGYMGESTGMSALEFITDANDTMEIYRTNQQNGTDGTLIGQIRNATDRFAITLQEDGESMLTAINSTQLTTKWRCDKGGTMEIHSTGAITSDSLEYDGWRLWNGHILLGRQQTTEYGKMHRIDTLDIIRLTNTELIIRNEYGELTSFHVL